jgi:trigger factor
LKITVERTADSEAVVNVELEWPELEKASNRAYQRLAQRYTVPGFRKGHAPRSMLERMVGKETIYQEGLEELIESSYRDAIRQHDLIPLAQPSIDAPELELGKPYTYVAHVVVQPPVELGDYHSVKAEPVDTTVTDEEIDAALQRLRENQAMWLPAERPAQAGDRITVDLKLTVGDRTISDLHDNEFELASERVGIFTGMDEHLIGVSEGENKQFTTTIPEDYTNTEIAGKEASYDVTVKGVKYRELPELDDELAKSISNFQTLDELRANVAEQLRTEKDYNARNEQRAQIIKSVVDQASVNVHSLLVQEEIDTMVRETQRMLERSRISLEQYLAMLQKDMEGYRAELEPEAEGRVKRNLVLDAVADAEKITASDADIQNWLEMYARVGGQRMRMRDLSASQRTAIAREIQRDKATEQLVEMALANSPTANEESPAATVPEERTQQPEAMAETSPEDGTEGTAPAQS